MDETPFSAPFSMRLYKWPCRTRGPLFEYRNAEGYSRSYFCFPCYPMIDCDCTARIEPNRIVYQIGLLLCRVTTGQATAKPRYRCQRAWVGRGTRKVP
jgi:hypothetical protein